ncbi:MAG: copper chaperone PCu(A)C [Hyphomicrobiales bacterium]|nr:copper chaperone PCu(A)C [Hyphomicrobiales bacterium]
MRHLFLACLAGLLAMGLPQGTSFAKDYTVGSIKIETPWSRATPGAAKVGAGYLKITNTGSAPDRLVAVEAGVAATSEIHEMKMDGGIARMRKLADGLALPPNATVELKPGGYHLMFMELKQPLEKGQTFPATLVFETAGKLTVEFSVAGIGAMAPDGADAAPKTGGGTRGSH